MGECGYSVWYMVYSGKEHSSSSALSAPPCARTRLRWTTRVPVAVARRQHRGRPSSATDTGALRHLLSRLSPQLFHLCPQLARSSLRDPAAPQSPPLRPSLPSVPSVLPPSFRWLGVYLGWSLQRHNYCLHTIIAGIRYAMQHRLCVVSPYCILPSSPTLLHTHHIHARSGPPHPPAYAACQYRSFPFPHYRASRSVSFPGDI